MTGFAPGDQVHISHLGTGVVREVRNGGRYLVEVKGRAVVVDAAQLAAIEPQKRRGKRHAGSATASQSDAPARPHASSSLDLHGMTTTDAIAALDEFISDALLAGLSVVRIIHGRSGGRIKAVVHARLGELSPVRQFRIDPGNPGVTILEL